MLRSRILLIVKNHRGIIHQRNLSADVGFIGIGNMGTRMAANLIKKGRKVKVYDASQEAARTVAGAHVCSSPRDAASDVSMVITMLPEGSIVRDVLVADDGIFKGIAKTSVLVDSSTIDPLQAQGLHMLAQEHGIAFLDAPVSGGVTGAEAGTLTFMIGGDEEVSKRVAPFLMQMGSRIVQCGGPGAGQIAKLCNNMILGISMIAIAEGMNLGNKMGLDMKTLASIINNSTGRCWSSDTYNPVPGLMPNVPAAKNYEGGFQTKLIAKDLALAQNVAVSCGAPIHLGSAAHQMFRTMSAYGYGNKDFSSVFKFLQGQNAF